MARAAADVHGADPAALGPARAETVPDSDFHTWVATMAEAVRADFRAHA